MNTKIQTELNYENKSAEKCIWDGGWQGRVGGRVNRGNVFKHFTNGNANTGNHSRTCSSVREQWYGVQMLGADSVIRIHSKCLGLSAIWRYSKWPEASWNLNGARPVCKRESAVLRCCEGHSRFHIIKFQLQPGRREEPDCCCCGKLRFSLL